MLVELIEAAAADRAAALAVNDVTYAELIAGVERAATALAARGVRPGERVALLGENRFGFVVAYLAALWLGAIAVPANPLYRAGDLGHLLADAEPALLVASEPSAPLALATGFPRERILLFGELEQTARDLTAARHDRTRVDPEAPALIVYTSGTTGKAKGATLNHRNLAAIVAQLLAAWRWQASDALLLTLPLFHVHGLIAGLTASLCAGGRVLLHERFDAARVAATLEEGAVTMFFGVPTMYVRLLEGPTSRMLPRLRLYVSGSAPLSPETHRAFQERFGSTILERYGATEFGFALGNRYGGPRIAGSVGIPLPGVRVSISDPERLRASPDGAIGELLVAGPNVFLGYWRNPEATGQAFWIDPDGTRWYRSGDLARYDRESDTYAIVGRIKELIITGGFNVYPREVEDAIEAYPGIRACAVIGKPDPARGEIPIAFVESNGSLDEVALLETVRAQLASFKVPKEIRVLEELPRNALGKLDKPRLRREHL